jgi:hypothetical protein
MQFLFVFIMALLVVVIGPRSVLASGWNDFSLRIDPGFMIVRASDIDIVLCRTDGSLVYNHDDYPGVGPISGYVVSPSHIFARHHGRVPRGRFAGDTFENVDTSRTFYFVVEKASAATPGKFGFAARVTTDGVRQDDGRPQGVFGPFDEQAFLRQTVGQVSAPFHWIEPSNPNVMKPIVGSLMFLVISAVVLGWPIVLIFAVIVVGYILWRRRTRDRVAAG